jgi:hypothetical protein
MLMRSEQLHHLPQFPDCQRLAFVPWVYLRRIISWTALFHRSLGYGQAPSLRLVQNIIRQRSPQKLILDTLLKKIG